MSANTLNIGLKITHCMPNQKYLLSEINRLATELN